MTTATAPTMNPTGLDDHAQSLIDARLDTIERMLLGQVPRADRLAIVRDVEAQIHDLLAERNPDDTDRDAVIAALARLDPPEAYLPEEGVAPTRSAAASRRPNVQPAPSAVDRPAGHLAAPGLGLVSGIVGIMSLFLMALMLMTLIIAMGHSIGAWAYLHIALRLLTSVTSVVAITLAVVNRLRGAWSVTGLATGFLALGTTAAVVFLYPG